MICWGILTLMKALSVQEAQLTLLFTLNGPVEDLEGYLKLTFTIFLVEPSKNVGTPLCLPVNCNSRLHRNALKMCFLFYPFSVCLFVSHFMSPQSLLLKKTKTKIELVVLWVILAVLSQTPLFLALMSSGCASNASSESRKNLYPSTRSADTSIQCGGPNLCSWFVVVWEVAGSAYCWRRP